MVFLITLIPWLINTICTNSNEFTMKRLTRILFIFSIAIMSNSCFVVQPTGLQNVKPGSIEKILIVSTINEEPVVNLLGLTIFENKRSHITDFEFHPGHYAIEQADSILKEKGFSTLKSDKPIPNNILLDLWSWERVVRVEAAKSLLAHGADAVILIEQLSTRTGFSHNHGQILEEHGLFLVRSIVGRRDRIKLPFRITYYDLQNAKPIEFKDFDTDTDTNFIDNFKHIVEASDVRDVDKNIIIENYVRKIDLALKEVLTPIKK